jgi:mannose/fructose/N-acetylgalactosamine-specific phosphotransferase system component IIB
MSHVKTKTIKLTEEEIDNFRAIADKFNVKFEVKQVKNNYHVTASEDKLIQWGYYE